MRLWKWQGCFWACLNSTSWRHENEFYYLGLPGCQHPVPWNLRSKAWNLKNGPQTRNLRAKARTWQSCAYGAGNSWPSRCLGQRFPCPQSCWAELLWVVDKTSRGSNPPTFAFVLVAILKSQFKTGFLWQLQHASLFHNHIIASP